MKLNLGCGFNHLEGFVNVDNRGVCSPDVLCNLGSERLPIDDDSVSFVCGYQFLEHLYDHELSFLFDELKRVCRKGAKMHFVSPYMDSPVIGMIGHRKMLSESSFITMDWLDVSCEIKFELMWYWMKKVIPIPYLKKTSIHYDMVVL